MEKRDAIELAIQALDSRNNVISIAKRREAVQALRTIFAPDRYTPIPCPCGHSACDKYQVRGIAPEAKFTLPQAIAVARVLNELPDE